MFPELSKETTIRFGFSEKADGTMSHPDKTEPESSANRERFFKKEGIDSGRIVYAELANATNVVRVDATQAGGWIDKTDGLVTNVPNLYLSISSADCFPVYFFDPITHSVGLAHAGWRGIVGGIVEGTVKRMMESFGTNVGDLRVGIGPGIRSCHFEIKEDVLPRFANDPDAVESRDGTLFVDLPRMIKRRLMEKGVRSERIEDSSLCTACETDRYFSFRRDKPSKATTMRAYIGLTS